VEGGGEEERRFTVRVAAGAPLRRAPAFRRWRRAMRDIDHVIMLLEFKAVLVQERIQRTLDMCFSAAQSDIAQLDECLCLMETLLHWRRVMLREKGFFCPPLRIIRFSSLLVASSSNQQESASHS
jgi:hypothetical protein